MLITIIIIYFIYIFVILIYFNNSFFFNNKSILLKIDNMKFLSVYLFSFLPKLNIIYFSKCTLIYSDFKHFESHILIINNFEKLKYLILLYIQTLKLHKSL
jgi:hypothetical protein